MIEQLRSILRDAPDRDATRSLAREYIQVRILEGMQRCGAMIPLAFHGGTALRILYGTPRFSEDLDFALERPDLGPFDLQTCLDRIGHDLRREGYQVATDSDPDRTVRVGWVRFTGLLHQLGLSPLREEKLRVKIEIDTNPPAGARLETTRLTRFVPLHIQHHDRASLLAGKVAAVLCRPWVKGRDLFDLYWYMGARDWPNPNQEMLANALRQAGEEVGNGQQLDWIGRLRNRVASIDWAAVERDLAPFLRSEDASRSFSQQDLLERLG